MLDTGIRVLLLYSRCLDNPYAVHVIPCTEKTKLALENRLLNGLIEHTLIVITKYISLFFR